MNIELHEIRKVYKTRGGGDVTALSGVSGTIESGEFVTLIGPSGCGKTTLLDIISGLAVPTSGQVRMDGQVLGPEERAARVGMVFQKSVLLPWRTALENVFAPAEMGRQPPARTREDELRRRAGDLLELVGLAGFTEKYPWELSGGMQQRVAIARALLLETSLMCMDEPFAALDEFTREQMHLEFLNLWSQQGFSTIFVTHNIFEAVFLSDRVLVMTPRPGRVVADVVSDLPRPRNREMIGSDAFARNVRRVREAMKEYWEEDVA